MRKTKKQKKFSFTTFFLVLIFLIGLSLVLYPTLSNYWNQRHQTKAITSYVEEVAAVSDEEYAKMMEAARAYNRSLLNRVNTYKQSAAEKEAYTDLLNLTGTGIMGYIEIPSISVSLPIYHGTSDLVLQSSAGHLEWTSLPTGGESTHCVLSGHRGLPSAKLFTNLDKLVEGDTFILRVMNEVMTYEVDRILIVEPQDTSALQVVEGMDYCTLVTCTPYGINTHRLLVRGHRVENTVEAATVLLTNEATRIEPMLVAVGISIPLLLVMIILVMVSDSLHRMGERSQEEKDER